MHKRVFWWSCGASAVAWCSKCGSARRCCVTLANSLKPWPGASCPQNEGVELDIWSLLQLCSHSVACATFCAYCWHRDSLEGMHGSTQSCLCSSGWALEYGSQGLLGFVWFTQTHNLRTAYNVSRLSILYIESILNILEELVHYFRYILQWETRSRILSWGFCS